MKKTDYENTIILLGPSSVGKSLMAPELAKKVGCDFFNVDDFICFVEFERMGCIGASERQQKQFIHDQLFLMMNNEPTKTLLMNPVYYEQTKQMIKEFVDLYNYYRQLVGGFGTFYEILAKHEKMLDEMENAVEGINILSITTAEILNIALPRIDGPLVLDMPASVGWNTDQIEISKKMLKSLQGWKEVDLDKIKFTINFVLESGKTVFLRPGRDYKYRNAAENSEENQLILKALEGYYEHADIEMSMNGLFNEPKNEHIKSRVWFDPKAERVRQKLKNNGEIKNICDQIIQMRNDLLDNAKLEL